MGAAPRYDGFAEWYDEKLAGYAGGYRSSASHLVRMLGPGRGSCLDIACGTGLHVEAIAATGRDVVGVDISADQLRLARRRTPMVARGDAVRLPFSDGSFETVTATYVHTDVDDVALVFREAERVLRPGGRFVYLGTHPCFVGHFIELRDERTRIVHAGYRDAGWHHDSPYVRPTGVLHRVGYRHVPLAELLTAVIASGLTLIAIEEPVEANPPASEIPGMLAFVATKGSPPRSSAAAMPSFR